MAHRDREVSGVVPAHARQRRCGPFCGLFWDGVIFAHRRHGAGMVRLNRRTRARCHAFGKVARHRGREAHGVGARAGKALGLRISECALRALCGAAAGNLQIEPAMHGEGHRTLRGLEVLRHIRIEVVFAVEHRMLLDLAVGGEARLHDVLDRALVGHGERPGQAQADRAHIGVRLVVVANLAAAEHLGVERRELGMNL